MIFKVYLLDYYGVLFFAWCVCILLVDAYSKPFQTSKMERFAKIVTSWKTGNYVKFDETGMLSCCK